jgi:hypothetical protein
MVSIETNLSTQNSGVVVKGDVSTGNMDCYGVVQRIITLDFSNGKKVMFFSVAGMMCLLTRIRKVEGIEKTDTES